MIQSKFRDYYGILKLLNTQPLDEDSKDLYFTPDTTEHFSKDSAVLRKIREWILLNPYKQKI